MVGHPKESDDYRTANPKNTSRRTVSGTNLTAPSPVTQFFRTNLATKRKSIIKYIEELPVLPAFLLMGSKEAEKNKKGKFQRYDCGWY